MQKCDALKSCDSHFMWNPIYYDPGSLGHIGYSSLDRSVWVARVSVLIAAWFTRCFPVFINSARDAVTIGEYMGYRLYMNLFIQTQRVPCEANSV